MRSHRRFLAYLMTCLACYIFTYMIVYVAGEISIDFILLTTHSAFEFTRFVQFEVRLYHSDMSFLKMIPKRAKIFSIIKAYLSFSIGV